MDKKTEKYCEILSKLENQILDIGSCFNIAILTTGDELGKYYEDECYYTNVIVRRDFTATVNQHRKGDEDLPPDEEFPPDVDKDLIPESKCWDLSKREVSTYLAATISPWLESYLTKMKQGIDTLLGLGVTCPSAIESLALLKVAYDRGEEVFSEFKQKNDPLDFVGEFEMYLSCYCGVNEISKRFEELQKRMGIETAKVRQFQSRMSKEQKIANISAYLLKNPYAKSSVVGKATEIDPSDVRHLWGPIKRMMQEGKKYKPTGTKQDGRIEAVDQSASCKICEAPLSESFHCTLCKEAIIGECRACHHTNSHPDTATP